MIRFTRALSRLAPALLLAAVLGSAGHAQEAPRLDSPVDCVLGEICFVQFLVDRDPGPGVLDYGCGGLTYNGHKGTDFRIPDLVVMAAGVSVIAAAEGVVRAVRVGMPDISANDVDAAVIGGARRATRWSSPIPAAGRASTRICARAACWCVRATGSASASPSA